MLVPLFSRILPTVSETDAPASTDRDTCASHKDNPGEKAISVMVPSGTVRR